MKYNEFTEYLTFGDTTAFVFDSPNNRYVYSSGEIFEDKFEDATEDTVFNVCNINDLPEVKSVMVENFLPELEPAENIQDDEYNEIKRRLETGDAKIGYYEVGDTTTYVLIL
jgi:hypothetical protein